MTPFAKLVRNALERYLERYEEGPELPVRFAEQAASFLRFSPRATVGEWLTFAVRLAAQAYRAGYVRGYEWSEREPAVRQQFGRASEQHEQDAQGWAHDWHWSQEAPPPPEQLAGLPERDPFAGLSPEQQVRYLQALSGHGMAGWRVVLEPKRKP